MKCLGLLQIRLGEDCQVKEQAEEVGGLVT